MTQTELRRNRVALEHALAQQRLEGLTVPPEVIVDMERVARGELTTGEVLELVIARYSHDKIFQ